MFVERKFGEKSKGLLDAVKKMQVDECHKQKAIALVCEDFGVYNKAKLPVELHAKFDEMVEEIYNRLIGGEEIIREAKKPKIHPDFLNHMSDEEKESFHRMGEITKKKDKEKKMFASAKREINRVKRKEMRKEDVELNEVSAKKLMAYRQGAVKDMQKTYDKDDEASNKKFRKRSKGFLKSLHKTNNTSSVRVPASESVENDGETINEISRELAANYAKKAKASRDRSLNIMKKTSNDKTYSKHSENASKRKTGYQTAVSKMSHIKVGDRTVDVKPYMYPDTKIKVNDTKNPNKQNYRFVSKK